MLKYEPLRLMLHIDDLLQMLRLSNFVRRPCTSTSYNYLKNFFMLNLLNPYAL